MGVAGLWDILRPAAKVRSLTELSVTEGFEANRNGLRGYRIGIDASIWFFHAEYGKEGENPVLRTLFFRCATLMHSPFLPLFVFDGPKRPEVKRGKKISRTSHKLIPGMKQIVEAFGFEWRMAPAEAEAELAYLNRIGVIDGVLSDDVDNFLFGATTVIRNPSNNLSGNRANPILNSDGKDDKNHTRIFQFADIKEHPDIRLTRGGMILVGLMSGGDYQQGGLSRCGVLTAHALAKCGLGDTLYTAATTLSRDQLLDFLVTWRHELRHELRTDSQGHIGRKMAALANSIPEDFPDIDILLSYVNPITSESLGRESNNLKLTWSKEPNLAKLAGTCEFYFEWGYREAIIKRFRTVLWHSVVLRILRRAVLDLDHAKARSLIPSTPKKTKKYDPDLCGTPSKMIAKHFSSLGLSDGYLSSESDIEEDPNQHLIIKIHSSRTHTSTDGVLEYRLEIAPMQLVRIAESGIKGTRAPEGPDEWADEDDEDAIRDKKKPPPDPDSHLRIWMPACMVQIVEPQLVKDFEEKLQKKAEKATSQNRKVAAGKGKRSKVDDRKGDSFETNFSKEPTEISESTYAADLLNRPSNVRAFIEKEDGSCFGAAIPNDFHLQGLSSSETNIKISKSLGEAKRTIQSDKKTNIVNPVDEEKPIKVRDLTIKDTKDTRKHIPKTTATAIPSALDLRKTMINNAGIGLQTTNKLFSTNSVALSQPDLKPSVQTARPRIVRRPKAVVPYVDVSDDESKWHKPTTSRSNAYKIPSKASYSEVYTERPFPMAPSDNDDLFWKDTRPTDFLGLPIKQLTPHLPSYSKYKKNNEIIAFEENKDLAKPPRNASRRDPQYPIGADFPSPTRRRNILIASSPTPPVRTSLVIEISSESDSDYNDAFEPQKTKERMQIPMLPKSKTKPKSKQIVEEIIDLTSS